MQKETFNVGGMVCGSCEGIIEEELLQIEGVKSVDASFGKGTVSVEYDDENLDRTVFKEAIGQMGYCVLEKPNDSKRKTFALAAILFGLYYIVKNTIGFNYIPQISEQMGYGLIFTAGLVTSVHCIAMCGGIAVSHGIGSGGKTGNIKPSLLYNAGRVVSYTIVGAAAGAIGQVLTPSGQLKGAVAILAGMLMVLMGMRMLGVISLPDFLSIRISKFVPGGTGILKKSPFTPFYVGLANGLMPCGPLQTMQIYALGTGSVLRGATAMFLFSLGTVPLMLGFGAVTSVIGKGLGNKVAKLSGAMVIALGVIMTGRGMALSGISLEFAQEQKNAQVAEIENGVQTLNMAVTAYGYDVDAQIVTVGTPVRINVDAQNINGCNNPISIPQYGVEVDIMEENIIEFTPDSEGAITISCWMGMVTTKIYAVNDTSSIDESSFEADDEYAGGGFGGCCGAQGESEAAIAEMDGEGQTVKMNVGWDGFSPNVLVVQKDIPVTWEIYGDEISYCNKTITIPGTDVSIDVEKGKKEVRFTPNATGEIRFTCWMGMLQGRIVVVDDIENVDLDSL
ncbi:Sulfite exporter TauE/SafE [Peptoclostridium litorale DSM 5388]|uniref:HMA domain-containing protein n=1 Tax=Peptoclostridium litorale DSM 5388 TaxID=1121324 RepID=A0A069RI54_PEPLI|nr:sulfite exporter TauE/SafE family protein [Peptoclostridium litorale]KDR96671.1 hypothetical protein CLIT_2c02770 [Peptoclostridium litorale DSM 5388]SIN67878.1 Sulfite exporter TauE/SafE [Peptoclostridium litorale DSM 5388]